jgi:hypothetical protein
MLKGGHRSAIALPRTPHFGVITMYCRAPARVEKSMIGGNIAVLDIRTLARLKSKPATSLSNFRLETNMFLGRKPQASSQRVLPNLCKRSFAIKIANIVHVSAMVPLIRHSIGITFVKIQKVPEVVARSVKKMKREMTPFFRVMKYLPTAFLQKQSAALSHSPEFIQDPYQLVKDALDFCR